MHRTCSNNNSPERLFAEYSGAEQPVFIKTKSDHGKEGEERRGFGFWGSLWEEPEHHATGNPSLGSLYNVWAWYALSFQVPTPSFDFLGSLRRLICCFFFFPISDLPIMY